MRRIELAYFRFNTHVYSLNQAHGSISRFGNAMNFCSKSNFCSKIEFSLFQAVIIYNIENTDVVNRVTYLLKQFTNTHVQTTAIQLLNNVTEDLFMSRVSLADIKSTTRGSNSRP
jgi:hypothetical protein